MNFPYVLSNVNETKLKIRTQYPVLSEAKNIPLLNATNYLITFFVWLLRVQHAKQNVNSIYSSNQFRA